jgi:SAM-dependent methyltransferase
MMPLGRREFRRFARDVQTAVDQAARADWRRLPIAAESVDLVLGDGCYAAMGPLAGARHLNREIRRVLKPRGWYCVRAFCRSDQASSIPELFDELEQGLVDNLDLFRWRLAMLVHGESVEGVALGKVRRIWRDHVREILPDPRRGRRTSVSTWRAGKTSRPGSVYVVAQLDPNKPSSLFGELEM